MNIFQFKHVGDGLFYTGSISDELNFVYDCGTRNNDKVLNSEILTIRQITESKNIDFVVISHLHENYFNGLLDLCTAYQVGKIYLPYLGENKELIRLLLVNAIFGIKDSSEKSSEDKLRLYVFMCKLYKIKSIYDDNEAFTFRLPKKIIMLGQEDVEGRQDYENSMWIRNVYKNYEANWSWTFVFVTKAFKKEVWRRLNSNFKDLFVTGEDISWEAFERKLLSHAAKAEKMKSLQSIYGTLFTGIDCHSVAEICSILLLHYPKLSRYSAYLSEYKTVNRSYLHSPKRKVEGVITLLTGDAVMDKALEMLIYTCGNFSSGGGVLQIPINSTMGNWNTVMNLAQRFKAYVLTSNNNAAPQLAKAVIPDLTMYPYQYARTTTQSTGITYFIE